MTTNYKWVTVILARDFSQTLIPRTLPLKQEPVPHQHHKIVKSSSMG